jgi:cytochrome c oxidase subunit 1
VSTIGAFVLGFSMLPFLYNVYRSYRYGEATNAEDPWGFGNSLEWASPTPPARHNFVSIPRIRSERPAWEYHYPHLVETSHEEAFAGWHKQAKDSGS